MVAGSKLTLDEALRKTLSESGNTTANILLDAAGVRPGASATNFAHKAGYKNTFIRSYYNSRGGTNETTAEDIGLALEDIYLKTLSTDPKEAKLYQTAFSYLQQNRVNFGLSSEANKWGGTSKTTGNSAIFAVNGQRYVISMYINKPYNDQASGSGLTINAATSEILNLISNLPSVANGADCGIPAGSFVFYEQCDPKWASHLIYSKGDRNLCHSGCGPTSVAMVVATLADKSVTPVQTGDYMTAIKGYAPEGATAEGMTKALEHWGLKTQQLGTDFDRAVQIIKAGGLVIAGGEGLSPFSRGGHVVTLRGLDGAGNFLIGNSSPGLQGNDRERSFSADQLRGSTLYMIGASK